MGTFLRGVNGFGRTEKRKGMNSYTFLARKSTDENIPSSSIGQRGDKEGDIIYGSSYIYYCSAKFNGVDNIWKRKAWTDASWD